jgi:hypothetical protein
MKSWCFRSQDRALGKLMPGGAVHGTNPLGAGDMSVLVSKNSSCMLRLVGSEVEDGARQGTEKTEEGQHSRRV